MSKFNKKHPSRHLRRLMVLLLIFPLIMGALPATSNAAEADRNVSQEDDRAITAIAISAGDISSFVILPDHSLRAWGIGEWYRFSNDPTNAEDDSIIMEDVAAISNGRQHQMIIQTDGSLWTMGWNRDGQLGDGTTENRLIPVRIMDDVIAVSASLYHSTAIKTDGSLWVWGSNWHGQVGDGTAAVRDPEGRILEANYHYLPVKIMDDVVAVSAAHYHTMAIRTDGSLWAWGSNWAGQLGDGTNTCRFSPVKVKEDVITVYAGWLSTFAITADGNLWAWGSDFSNTLGDGATTESNRPIKIMDNVVDVSAGSHHTMVIRTDGSLWAWGANWSGQLGDGTNTHRFSPVRVMEDVAVVSAGTHHTMAIKTDGSLWAWGSKRDSLQSAVPIVVNTSALGLRAPIPRALEAPLSYANADDLLSAVGMAKFSEFAVPGDRTFNIPSDVSARGFEVLQGLTMLYESAEVRQGFTLQGISVRGANVLTFHYGNNAGDIANFIWSRSIAAENATTDFFGRGAISERMEERSEITLAITEWVTHDTQEPDGWVVSWAQHGQAFMAALPASFTEEDVLAFCYAQPITSWELEGNAISVSIQGMGDVSIFERTVGIAGFDGTGNEINVIGNILYSGSRRVGYRWLIDYTSQRFQYVLRPGAYEFHIEAAVGQPEINIQHFVNGSRTVSTNFTESLARHLSSGFHLIVTSDPNDSYLTVAAE